MQNNLTSAGLLSRQPIGKYEPSERGEGQDWKDHAALREIRTDGKMIARDVFPQVMLLGLMNRPEYQLRTTPVGFSATISMRNPSNSKSRSIGPLQGMFAGAQRMQVVAMGTSEYQDLLEGNNSGSTLIGSSNSAPY